MRHLVLFTLFLIFGSGSAATTPSPAERMVQMTLGSLARLVADCRLQLAADPVALRGVIEQELRPRADVLYAGQLILGRHWTDADPDQRRRFAEALYGTLVNRYSTGLLLLTDRNVSVVGPDRHAREGEAQVELQILTPMGAPIPVFLELRRGHDSWRIYDARWEGQSYVLSLRQAFSEQIRRDGLETVIRRLEATAGSPPGSPLERETSAGRCLRARMAL
jgi:phospholipid transport system substrate-binding protein